MNLHRYRKLAIFAALLIANFAFPPAVVADTGLPTLRWSSAGPIGGMVCTQLIESADPHTWSDNYLCADRDVGFRWSSAGSITDMRCTQLIETADPHTWNDNYLCVEEANFDNLVGLYAPIVHFNDNEHYFPTYAERFIADLRSGHQRGRPAGAGAEGAHRGGDPG